MLVPTFFPLFSFVKIFVELAILWSVSSETKFNQRVSPNYGFLHIIVKYSI